MLLLGLLTLPGNENNVQININQKASSQEPSTPDDRRISQDEIAILIYNIMFCDSLGGIEE